MIVWDGWTTSSSPEAAIPAIPWNQLFVAGLFALWEHGRRPKCCSSSLQGYLLGHFGQWYDMIWPASKSKIIFPFFFCLTDAAPRICQLKQHVWADGWLFETFSIQRVVQCCSKARLLRLTTWWRDPRPALLGLHVFLYSRRGGEDLNNLWSSPVATGFRG